MIKVESYRKRPEQVEAVKWSAADGWEAALGIAEWCGGKADRDEHPENRDKTYYWAIFSIDIGGYARPGQWIVRRGDDFHVMDHEAFTRQFELEVG